MENTLSKKRNVNLDLMRFTGILIIMIAHAKPPFWIFQLRNFGTPLLILGSALTYSFIYQNKTINKDVFFKKRLKRLLIPLWLFLTIFFVFYWAGSLILEKNFPFTIMTIVNSYTLFSGIGFVWIFKVYIILALITPLSLKLCYSSISNRKYFITIIFLYLIYELIVFLFYGKIPINVKEFISQYFLIIIPYSALYLYGLRLHTLNNKHLIIVSLFSLLLFFVLVYQKHSEFNRFIPTQGYKYPPTLYYLSYAFFCINALYFLISNYIKLNQSKVKNAVIWLSSNSLWIYLWHIFAYYLWIYLMIGVFEIENHFGTLVLFLINTSFLLGVGISMTCIQKVIIDRLLLKNNTNLNKVLVFLK